MAFRIIVVMGIHHGTFGSGIGTKLDHEVDPLKVAGMTEESQCTLGLLLQLGSQFWTQFLAFLEDSYSRSHLISECVRAQRAGRGLGRLRAPGRSG